MYVFVEESFFFTPVESLMLTIELDSAYHLTSTATLLLRCAFETPDTDIAKSCMSKLDMLREALSRAKRDYDWDLADMCLDHCERILSKYPGATFEDIQTSEPKDQTLGTAKGLSETLMPSDTDFDNMIGSLDPIYGFPFDMTGVWDVPGLEDGSFV